MFMHYFFHGNMKTQNFSSFHLMFAVVLMALGGCSNADPSSFSNNAKPIMEGRVATVGGVCSLDSIAKKQVVNGAYRIKTGGDALFSGWAWDMEQNTPSNYVAIRLIDDVTGEASYAYTSSRGLRSDVATYLKVSPDAKVGFELIAKNLPKKLGSYHVELLQVWPNIVKECKIPMPLILE